MPAKKKTTKKVVSKPVEEEVKEEDVVEQEPVPIKHEVKSVDKPDVLTMELSHLFDCIINRFFRGDKDMFNKQIYHLIGQRYGYFVPEMKRREKLWK